MIANFDYNYLSPENYLAADYRSLETLEEYVLISQERISVDCFRRNDEGFWVLYPYSKGADIYLASIDFHCALESLYEDLTEIP